MVNPDHRNMYLPLSPHFTFAEFKRASPIDAHNVLSLVMDRHAHRVTVKRATVANDKLRKIFEATFSLANKTGFAAMTLRDLCKETGLSMGGLYGYISSKDDLAAVIEDVVRHLGTVIPTWFITQPTAMTRLDATLRAHLFLSEILQPWFYFVFMESRLLAGPQKAVAKSSELYFHDVLAQLVTQAGVSDPTQAQLTAAHCLSLVQDWHVKRWKYRQLKVSVDVFANSVSDLLGGLQSTTGWAAAPPAR